MHGIHVRGFPNLFIVGVAHGANLISNIPHNFVEAAGAISAIVKHALAEGSEQVEVTAGAEQAWVDILDNGIGSFLGSPDCTPSYYNNEGGPIGRGERLNGSGYPQGAVAYFDYLEKWRSSGDFAGLEFRSLVPQGR
jgi:cyclohexanone monooxygenase